MGLVLIQARFDRGAPGADAISKEVERQLGSTRALDSVEMHGEFVNILLSPDSVARAYVIKAILELGGECVDGAGKRADASLPRYVGRPWSQWPFWKRALFRIGL